MVIQDDRRFLAGWDDAAGQWQGIEAFDGVEREKYFQEWPGRLYGVTHWLPPCHGRPADVAEGGLLKDCDDCGAAAMERAGAEGLWVSCSGGCCRSGVFQTFAEAANAWNQGERQ